MSIPTLSRRTSRERVVQLCADDRHQTEARARATGVGFLELVHSDSEFAAVASAAAQRERKRGA
jgi:hypothetical protein